MYAIRDLVGPSQIFNLLAVLMSQLIVEVYIDLVGPSQSCFKIKTIPTSDDQNNLAENISNSIKQQQTMIRRRLSSSPSSSLTTPLSAS